MHQEVSLDDERATRIIEEMKGFEYVIVLSLCSAAPLRVNEVEHRPQLKYREQV